MDINSDKYVGITQWETLSGTEGPNVPHFFVGDEGFALNRSILRPFGGPNMSVKKKCINIACADHAGLWNVLLEFWAIKREFFQRPLNVSPDFAVIIVKASVVLHSFVRERDG